MKSKIKGLLAVALSLGTGMSSLASTTTVYACQSSQGVRSFSQTPCNFDAKSLGVKSIVQSNAVVANKAIAPAAQGILRAPTDASQGVPPASALSGLTGIVRKVSPS